MDLEDKRPRLGLPSKCALTVGSGLALGLVIAVGLVLRRQHVERRNRDATQEILESLAEDVRDFEGDPPRRDGGDLTDLSILVQGEISLPARPARRRSSRMSGGTIKLGEAYTHMDAWGNLIRYRCPGPNHKNGWDLWSVGPNGIDEQGAGDDLLVGEDVAEVPSGD